MHVSWKWCLSTVDKRCLVSCDAKMASSTRSEPCESTRTCQVPLLHSLMLFSWCFHCPNDICSVHERTGARHSWCCSELQYRLKFKRKGSKELRRTIVHSICVLIKVNCTTGCPKLPDYLASMYHRQWGSLFSEKYVPFEDLEVTKEEAEDWSRMIKHVLLV